MMSDEDSSPLPLRAKGVHWAASTSHNPVTNTRPARHQPAADKDVTCMVSAASRGPIFRPPYGTYIKPGDRGLAGLLSRYLEVSKAKWDRYIARLKAGKRDRPRRSVVLGLPMLHPLSTPAHAWMAFMLAVDLIYTAFIVPINVAFCTADYAFSAHDSCTQVDIVGGVIYFTNMLFMFTCGIVMSYANLKIVVMDGPDVARYYVTSSRFLLDVAAVIPFIYLVILLGIHPPRASVSWIHLLSLVRLLRMARMMSISRLVTLDMASGQYKKLPFLGRLLTVPIMYTALLVYVLMVVVNLQASILVLQAELQPEGVLTFYDSVDWIDAWGQPDAYKWYFAIYWVITTATGTGFGDVSPKNETEQVLANCNMILGVLMFGLLVGTVSNGLTRASAAAAKLYAHRKKVAEVDSWIETRDIRKGLKEEIQAYFLQYWRGQSSTTPEQTILRDLPAHLRDCALSHIVEPLVAQVHGLQVMPPQLQSLVSGLFRAVTFLPGHDICVQGRDADRLWIVERGAVIVLQYQEAMPEVHSRLSRHKLARYSRISSLSHPAQVLDEVAEDEPTDTRYSPCYVPLSHPCLIGESVMLSDDIPTCRQRLVTYRAIEECVAWELKMSDLWPLMHLYPQIKVVMLGYLRDRLCREVVGAKCDPDNHYCELAVVIARELNKPGADQRKLDDLVTELQRADIESGELSSILATLAEACCVQPWSPEAAGAGADGTPMHVQDSERLPPSFMAHQDSGGLRAHDNPLATASSQGEQQPAGAAPHVSLTLTGRQQSAGGHRMSGDFARAVGRRSMPLTTDIAAAAAAAARPSANGAAAHAIKHNLQVSIPLASTASGNGGSGALTLTTSSSDAASGTHSDAAFTRTTSLPVHSSRHRPDGGSPQSPDMPPMLLQPAFSDADASMLQADSGPRAASMVVPLHAAPRLPAVGMSPASRASMRQLSRFVRHSVVLEDDAEGESDVSGSHAGPGSIAEGGTSPQGTPPALPRTDSERERGSRPSKSTGDLQQLLRDAGAEGEGNVQDGETSRPDDGGPEAGGMPGGTGAPTRRAATISDYGAGSRAGSGSPTRGATGTSPPAGGGVRVGSPPGMRPLPIPHTLDTVMQQLQQQQQQQQQPGQGSKGNGGSPTQPDEPAVPQHAQAAPPPPQQPPAVDQQPQTAVHLQRHPSTADAACQAHCPAAALPALPPVATAPGALMQLARDSASAASVCQACGHAICPTCAHVLAHPVSAPSAAGMLAATAFAAHERALQAVSDGVLPRDAAGSGTSARSGATSVAARLVSQWVPPNGRARLSALNPWRRSFVASGLERASTRLGTTSIDRYNNLGVVSIPLQAQADLQME